jgi:predicted TIM-barrel enzyme
MARTRFCNFDHFPDEVIRAGFSGVQNFPTVGLIDGNFRLNLEETGLPLLPKAATHPALPHARIVYIRFS